MDDLSAAVETSFRFQDVESFEEVDGKSLPQEESLRKDPLLKKSDKLNMHNATINESSINLLNNKYPELHKQDH